MRPNPPTSWSTLRACCIPKTKRIFKRHLTAARYCLLVWLIALFAAACGPPDPMTLELSMAKPTGRDYTEGIHNDVLRAACRDLAGAASTKLIRQGPRSQTFRVRCNKEDERTVIVKYTG